MKKVLAMALVLMMAATVFAADKAAAPKVAEKAAVKVETSRSIETWLTNTDSFSADWVSAVEEIFTQTRSIAVF